VYCTGRSVRGHSATAGRPETIDETAELVTDAGGAGIAVQTDHTHPDQVEALVERIKADHGHLDVLVNDVWGGDELTEWGKPLWEHSLEKGLLMLERAVHSHIITSRLAIPLMLDRDGALLVEVTDGVTPSYRGNVYYDLVKSSAIRLAMALGYELRERGVTAVAVTPGFLRSERMLALFGVTEATWREHAARDPHWSESETPLFVGRCIAALAADPERWRWNGSALASWDLAERYGIDDADGRRPHWGRYIAAQTDQRWAELLNQVRTRFAREAPAAQIDADRSTLTLRVGSVTRPVLEPELYWSKPDALIAELLGLYEKSVGVTS
jgi:NAD(P)-dependent dehydrogenase (short-subunit alcohol dehydrogenase family)